MNLPVLIFVGIAALLFIILLVLKNQKDKKEVIDQMKNDYPKAKDEEGDADIDNKSRMRWVAIFYPPEICLIPSIFAASLQSFTIALRLISSGIWNIL